MIDNEKISLEEFPLFKDINTTIKQQSSYIRGIRVSITPEGEWYTPKDEDEQYWVKWMCWNLFGQEGQDVTEPKFCVISGDTDQVQFEADLSKVFNLLECIVDNEIIME